MNKINAQNSQLKILKMLPILAADMCVKIVKRVFKIEIEPWQHVHLARKI